MSRMHVTCVVNGDTVEFLCDGGQSLLDALRADVGLLGTKNGCSTGDCGACSVIVDGKLVCACLMFAPEVDGSNIVTIEGLADQDTLHPLQQSFLEEAALQCGVCTPGFLMAAKALLDAKSRPTETEVRFALAGNLCRCTGYDKIVRAVLACAETSPEPSSSAASHMMSSSNPMTSSSNAASSVTSEVSGYGRT